MTYFEKLILPVIINYLHIDVRLTGKDRSLYYMTADMLNFHLARLGAVFRGDNQLNLQVKE